MVMEGVPTHPYGLAPLPDRQVNSISILLSVLSYVVTGQNALLPPPGAL